MRFALCWAFVPFLLSAQSGAADFQKLLQQHQAGIPFKSTFTQVKSMSEMGLELKSEGELEVKSVGHANWKIIKPSYLNVLVSPEEIKVYSDPKSTPRIVNKDKGKASSLEDIGWMELLMEKPETVIQHFQIIQITPLSFKLLPKNPKHGFDYVQLTFGVKRKITEVFIQENKEDSLKISFKSKVK